MNRHIARPDLLAALFLLLPPLIMFWPVTLGPYTLLPADNLFAYEPWRSYRAELDVGLPQNQLVSDLILENYVWKRYTQETLSTGQLPLWNPHILAGQPFLANGQHSAYYPISLLFYLLPLPQAYGWFTLIHLWLAGLNMYIFVRVVRGPPLAALVAGLTFSMSSFFIVRVVFTMVIAGAVWLPLLLACIEMVIRKQEEKGPVSYSPIPYIIAGSAILGLQTLAGHVEITYYTLLVSGFYTACRLMFLWRAQRTWRYATRLALWLLLMVLLGVGLGSIQLLPMYEVVSQNFRDEAVTLEQVRDWALPIRRVATFIMPHFFGSPAQHHYFDVISRTWQPLGLNAHGTINPLCPNCTSWDTKTAVEAGAYAGILPLMLAFLAIAQALYDFHRTRTLSQPARYILIFSMLAVLSLLFAFGTPLYGLLFYGLPGWNQLHSPFRWLYPYTLSLALLAGFGTAYLHQSVSARWQRPPTAYTPNLSHWFYQPEINRYRNWLTRIDPHTTPYSIAPPSFIGSLSWYLAWLLFWSGLAGVFLMLMALLVPQPFISIASLIFERSGLAQNAFATGRQFFGYQWPNLLMLFLMVTASGAVLRISRCPIFTPRSVAWQPALIIIIWLDLFMAGYGFNPAVNPALLDFTPPVVKWLQAQQVEDPLFRLTSFETAEGPGNKILLANMPMRYGLYDVRGYDSIIPAQYGRFMQLIQENGDLLFNRIGPIYAPGYAALDSALLDLLGVRYVLTMVDIPNDNYRLVYDAEIKVYENLDALPRAFIVPHADDRSGAPWADLSYALRSLNPRERLILDGESNRPAEPFTLSSPPSESNMVSITRYSPIEINLTVNLADDGWVVLADSYFPGWRAYARAQPLQPETANLTPESELTIHRANGNFRAVQLPAGTWEVRFRYSPRSFQVGVYVSFLAGVILAFMLSYWSWGKLYREHETDSAIKRVAKNSLVPMIMALSNRIIDFAFALLMLRILQPDGAGRYAFAVAFIGMIEILTRYGLGTLVTREVAAVRSERNRYLSNVSLLRLYLWLIALPFMGAILALYLIFGGLTFDVIITVAIFSIGTLFSNLSDGLTAMFYAHEKAEYPAAIASVTTLTRVSVGALVLLLGWGIIGLAMASLLANLVAFSVLSYIMLTKIFRPTFAHDPTLQRHMMGESLPLMLNHLLSTIFFRIDVFILSPTWGDDAVGFYNAAYKYIDGINVIPQYFTLAIFPLMSRFAASSRESLVRAYLLSLRLLMLLAIPLAIGTPFVAYELILFLAGERFIPDSVIVLQLLIWFLPFSFINQVTQYVLIAVNQQRALTRAFVIGVSFNLIANLIFVPLYGYRAAAITTIISEWSLLIPFYLLVREHLCTVPWLDVIWRPIVAGAVMGGLLWWLDDLSFMLTVLVAVSSYGLSLLLLGGLHQPDMALLWQRIPGLKYIM